MNVRVFEARSPAPVATCLAWLACSLGAQVDVTLTAAPGTVEIAPGQTVAGWFYDGRLPGPALRAKEGETVRVRLRNRLPEPTTIHWHGLPVPSGMDGVPHASRPAIQPGQEFTYTFPASPAGTYFFHPHVGLQLDRGLYGTLIVVPAAGDPPFDREHLIVLDDWLAGPPLPGQDPVYATWLLNGRTSLGQAALDVRRGEQVRLRFVNASAATHYAVAVDGHPMTVTHADGRPVRPVVVDALSLGAGERYDVMISADRPGAWSVAAAGVAARGTTLVRGVLVYEGSPQPWPAPAYVPPALRNGSLLTYAQLASAAPSPVSPNPARVHDLALAGGMSPYVWTIGGQAFPNATPLAVQSGEIVQMDLTNRTMAWHPMHLHGHFFRLLGTAGGTTHAPLKDTVLVPAGMMAGPVRFQFLADNPGNWAFHCHMIYHGEAGMMRLLEYVNGDADRDGIPDGKDLDPLSAYPVTMSDDQGGRYAPGTRVDLLAQWRAGEVVLFHLGGIRRTALDLGLLGTLALEPAFFAGAAVAGPAHVALLSLGIPLDPALVGLRAGNQCVATHATLAPGARLSTLDVVTVR
jgi:FtsP/CotA-like multicopper oxidase with cupredoxin domain